MQKRIDQNSPEKIPGRLTRQAVNAARRIESAHVANGGVSLLDLDETPTDTPVDKSVDAQQISYTQAFIRQGLPVPETLPLGTDGVSVKLSDRYAALEGIAKANAKRSSAIGIQSDSAWASIEERYAVPEDVVIGSNENAKKLERKVDGHFEKLIAGKVFIAMGADPGRTKALGNTLKRDVGKELGVGVGKVHRNKVLDRVWDGTPEKAKRIKNIQKWEADRRKRLSDFARIDNYFADQKKPAANVTEATTIVSNRDH